MEPSGYFKGREADFELFPSAVETDRSGRGQTNYGSWLIYIYITQNCIKTENTRVRGNRLRDHKYLITLLFFTLQVLHIGLPPVPHLSKPPFFL